jgi:hypothetical protein
MAASSFVSTSVFVYQLDNSDPRKQAIAKALVRDALRTQGCSAKTFSTDRRSNN